ncbi:MAG TPA: hypothetical protein ACFYD8_13235, partial [Candidatus Wujingus californicus]|uniref:hypothetical protein n=1 Tax=Candidatus Wujingus californicus TaxID=3367618 RepID=UPI004026EC1B
MKNIKFKVQNSAVCILRFGVISQQDKRLSCWIPNLEIFVHKILFFTFKSFCYFAQKLFLVERLF